jgi:hypothetical protein
MRQARSFNSDRGNWSYQTKPRDKRRQKDMPLCVKQANSGAQKDIKIAIMENEFEVMFLLFVLLADST